MASTMIIDLPDTDTAQISRELVSARERIGISALGRVLTLVVIASADEEADTIATASDTAREHPMRLIVLVPEPDHHDSGLDAQLRIGFDSGASEIIVIRSRGAVAMALDTVATGLLLPDAPVVLWFTGKQTRADVGTLDNLAARRITDVAHSSDAVGCLRTLAAAQRPGATDLAWSQLTVLRSQLAATLDQPPYLTVTGISIEGDPDQPELLLLAAWLVLRLGVPAQITAIRSALSIETVRLTRPDGDIVLTGDVEAGVSRLELPGQPVQKLPLTQRSPAECLSEELRSIDDDVVYSNVLKHGLPLIADVVSAAR